MKKLLLTILLLSQPVFAAHVHPEKYYQSKWCSANQGIQEYVLSDKTRADCVTSQYALEVDFAPKWAESVGQSLYYSLKTGKQPAVLLILENPYKDAKYLKRLNAVSDKYNIKVFTITH